MDKQTQSRSVTFDPAGPPVVLLLERGTSMLADLQVSHRAADQ